MATRGRWGGLRPDPYNPNAFDADGDGIVQEGTAFERPAFTVILDEAGNPIPTNLRSDTRPQNWRIVNRRTGQEVPYVPSYQRAQSQQIANRVGTVGGRVGTLKDIVGTIGDRVPTLEQMVGTIVSAPEPQITMDFVAERDGINSPVAYSAPIEINFDDINERNVISRNIGALKDDVMPSLYELLPDGWVDRVDLGDGRPVFVRTFPEGMDESDWLNSVQRIIDNDRETTDQQRELLTQAINDLRAIDELQSVEAWTRERPSSTTADPFASSDPFATPGIVEPEAPYSFNEARRIYLQSLDKLSSNRRNEIVRSLTDERTERNASAAERLAINAVSNELINKKQRMLNPPDVPVRRHAPQAGSALVGQRNASAREISGVSAGEKSVTTIQSQADDVLVKTGDLSSEIYEEDLLSLLADDEIAVLLGEMESQPSVAGQRIIERFVGIRGFDGDVLTVSGNELDDMVAEGYKELTRGGSEYPNQQFIEGDLLLGTGIDGAGLYFASETFRPNGILAVNPHFDAVGYARSVSGEGTVIRAVFNPSSKKANIRRLQRKLSGYRDHLDGFEPEPEDSELYFLRARLSAQAQTDDSYAKALQTLDSILLAPYADINHAIPFAAILMGFDAVVDSSDSNRTILYNRSAVIAASRTLSPDEADASIGYENFKKRYNERLKAKGDLPLDASDDEIEQWRQKRISQIVGGADVDLFSSNDTPGITLDNRGGGSQSRGRQQSRNLDPRTVGARLARINSGKIKKNDLPDFARLGLSKTDGMAAESRMQSKIDEIDTRYGKIETVQGAVDALSQAFPFLSETPYFLASKSPTDELSTTERATVYGYLDLVSDLPIISRYNILFKKTKDGTGGSASIQIADENGNVFTDRPRLIFGVKVDDDYFKNDFLKDLALLTGLDSSASLARMETSSSKAATSFIYDGLEANVPIEEVFSRAEFLHSFYIATHEGGHAADFLATLRDAFGNDAKIEDIRRALEQAINDQGFGQVAKNRIIDGVIEEVVQGQNEKLPVLNRIIQTLSESEARLINAFASHYNRQPNQTELDNIYLMAWYSLVYDDPSSSSATLNPLGQYFHQHIAEIYDPQTGAKNRLNRASIIAARDEIRNKIDRANQILSQEKYKPIVDFIAMNKLVIAEARSRQATLAQYVNGIDPRSAEVAGLGRSDYGMIVMDLPELVSDFVDEFAPDADALANEWFDEQLSKFNLAFFHLTNQALMDGLSEDEIGDVRSYGSEISQYGGDRQASYYNYSRLGAPAEAIAEIAVGLQSGIVPKLGSPEYYAVRKLFIWMYGEDYWQKIERENYE